ncbi:MAG: NADH:ubiquinone reductase (Na(+)-transporting) subunit A [Deltaproteobacteria bacterium]|nr:NADH:ubiquinone reductase (Na(+)-transporting) subunit A [Deltaproteobacteria bacterium]
MAEYHIKKGLDVPITGEPTQEIHAHTKHVDLVAIVAADFVGMKPKMLCEEGSLVKRGQPLFEDRKNPGVLHTALGAGTVIKINRGAKRALQTVVIELNENERTGAPNAEDLYPFESYKEGSEYSPEELEALLVESGMWTSIRTRPYSRNPELGSRPNALFLTCTDSEPLCGDSDVILAGQEEDFVAGAKALASLSPKTFLCVGKGSKVPDVPGTEKQVFYGKHPHGLAGTHMAHLYPVSRKRIAWHIHLQEIIAIGYLLRTGTLKAERIVSIAGPTAKNPRLVRTHIGASTEILCSGEFDDGEETYISHGHEKTGRTHRLIAGSAVSGRTAQGEIHGFLGRFHRQVTILKEGREREFIGWMLPGGNKFSTIPIFLSALFGSKKFNFTTTTHGEEREMVPIGMYERIMPLDIMPTFLLRAMEIGDLERAEQLGALELDEEDLALCSFVCPGKQEHGIHLRTTLNAIHKEG